MTCQARQTVWVPPPTCWHWGAILLGPPSDVPCSSVRGLPSSLLFRMHPIIGGSLLSVSGVLSGYIFRAVGVTHFHEFRTGGRSGLALRLLLG